MAVTGSNGTGSLQVMVGHTFVNWNTGSAGGGTPTPIATPTSGQIFPRGILGK